MAGVGDDRHVARVEQRERKMEDPLLRPDDGEDLALGVELHAEAPVHEGSDLPPEVRQPDLERIARVDRIGRRLAERGNPGGGPGLEHVTLHELHQHLHELQHLSI